MAVAKNAAEAELNQVQKKYDPWKDRVPFFLPKTTTTDETSKYVCVNGKPYQVPYGKTSRLPRPVYDVLKRSLEAEEKSEARKRQLQERMQQEQRYL